MRNHLLGTIKLVGYAFFYHKIYDSKKEGEKEIFKLLISTL